MYALASKARDLLRILDGAYSKADIMIWFIAGDTFIPKHMQEITHVLDHFDQMLECLVEFKIDGRHVLDEINIEEFLYKLCDIYHQYQMNVLSNKKHLTWRQLREELEVVELSLGSVVYQ